MKLVELKILKKDTVYRRILHELKLNGLDEIYIKKTDTIDFLDIILSVIDFLENNKNILKRINSDQYENIVIIIIDEIFEELGYQTNEEQIEKIMKLLKNSLLVQKVSKYLIAKFIHIIKKINIFCCNYKSIENSVISQTKNDEKTENNTIVNIDIK